MPVTASGQPYNLSILYHSNWRTGEIELLVDYESEPGTGVQTHFDQHSRIVQKLLERAGILTGSCVVRVRHENTEYVYRVEKTAETWDWLLINTPQSLVEPPADRNDVQVSESIPQVIKESRA